jgi:hypothetical protein
MQNTRQTAVKPLVSAEPEINLGFPWHDVTGLLSAMEDRKAA